MKEYRIPKLMFWIFFAIGMFYGAFFLFLLEHPLIETNRESISNSDYLLLCDTTNMLVSQNNRLSVLVNSCYGTDLKNLTLLPCP